MTKKGRKISTIILTLVLVLSMTTSVFAGWATYDTSLGANRGVHLKEEWVDGAQFIHYYTGDKLERTVAGRGYTLWIDSWPMLQTLYDTNYWCFDKMGNIWAIDTSQKLLWCKAGTIEFQVNTSVAYCTGFQRDEGKFGYIVYTENGSYNLNDILRGYYSNLNNYNNYNYDSYSNDNYYNNDYYHTYPYVEKSGNTYYYYENSNKYYKYSLSGSTLYYKGTNNSSSSTKLATSVKDITFYNDGYNSYVVYATTGKEVYSYPIGKTTSSNKKRAGSNFSYFDEYNYMSNGYYTTSGGYKDFFNDYNNYPYVEQSGNYYYYYVSSNKYYQYYLSGSTLYYKGTNSSSSNIKIASDVEEITFSSYDYNGYDGYIVYANSDNYVYAYPLGKTSSTYKVRLAKNYRYFEEPDNISEGYYDRYDDFNEFDF